MTRTYRSALRTQQAASTREQILAALVEQLGEGVEEFSIPRVAQRAGVSVRTVYHHFPNREVQIEAVAQHLDARIASSEPGPTALSEIPSMAARIFRRALDNMSEVRAQLVPGVARLVREHRRRGREQAINKAVARACDDPAAARRAAAALTTMISADIAVTLLDRYKLDPDAAELTQNWIVKVLVDAIQRGDLPVASRSNLRRR